MTLPFGKTALLLGAAALLEPVTASAQNVRDLKSEVSDVLIFEGSVRDEPVVFRYSMAAESSLIVDVIPTGESELDPMVTITDADTGEVLAEDDDGGEGLASRAVVFASEPRSIEITVSAFAFFSGEESAGAFELKLRPGDQTPEPLRAIAFGEQASGTLDGENLQLFSITGSEGELLQVALVADGEDLDPMLTLYSGEGTFAEELASDDDGGEGLNSRLVVDLGSIASDDDWLERLRITASSIGEGGAFELEITEGGF